MMDPTNNYESAIASIDQTAPAYNTPDPNIDSKIYITDYNDGNNVELGSLMFGIQTKEPANSNSYHIITHSLPSVVENCASNEDKECLECKTSDVPMYHMRRDHLENLKTSTKRLLCLLEDVQEKTHSTALVHDDPPKLSKALKPLITGENDKRDNFMDRSISDLVSSAAMKRLEKSTKELDAIIITDEDDDCSVYKRLTRKCHCLNKKEYNDFIIHFNEDTKYCTNTIGEIIKNMRIIKRFLYIGGTYTNHALLFLNQGLEECSQREKAEIVQACAFADLCCIFEPHTIVTVLISWPCKSPGFIEPEAQEMTAELLHHLAKLEEGRRYLNFNSKITCDIKKVLKKQQDKVNCNTIELLNSVLALCQVQTPIPTIVPQGQTPIPTIVPQSQRPVATIALQSTNAPLTYQSYQCRPMEEAIGNKTLNALIAYRRFMTTNELFLNLDILHSLSTNEEKKMELKSYLPAMITLFKNMLLEYNNSEINVIIANIMNNIVGCTSDTGLTILPGETITVCTATEAIKKQNVNTQAPPPLPKKNTKTHTQHQRQYSRRAIVVKKKDGASKSFTPQLKNRDEPQSNANKSSYRDRSRSAPLLNNVNRSRKWEPSIAKLKEYAPVKEDVFHVYTKNFVKSNRTFIVVPMEEETKSNSNDTE